MKYIGVSGLCNALHLAPPDTNWDDITGNAGGAKCALLERIKWPRTQWRAFKELGL